MNTAHKVFDRNKLVHAPYQKLYIDRVPTNELLNEMEIQLNHARHFYSAVTPDRQTYRYALGKWSLKEIVQHVMDWERIMIARALLIARGIQGPHSGYDQEVINTHAEAEIRALDDMLIEWAHLRRSTIGLFQTFSDDMMNRQGLIDASAQNVLAIGYFIVGHEMHHRHIYAERYLDEPMS